MSLKWSIFHIHHAVLQFTYTTRNVLEMINISHTPHSSTVTYTTWDVFIYEHISSFCVQVNISWTIYIVIPKRTIQSSVQN